MYAVVRRYRFDPKNSEEISRRIKEVFVHLVRQSPSFVSYFWLDTGEGEGGSLTVFRHRGGAEESTRMAASFVEQHLATLLGNPEIIQGEFKRARIELVTSNQDTSLHHTPERERKRPNFLDQSH